MKILYLLTIAFASVAFSACEYNGSELKAENKNDCDGERIEVLSQIESFNNSIISSKIVMRGSSQSNIWKRVQLVAADCGSAYMCGRAGLYVGGLLSPAGAGVGAVLGAIVGGACGSYVAYASLYWTRSTQCLLSPLAIAATYNAVLDTCDIENYVLKDLTIKYPTINEDVNLMGAKHNLILDKIISNEIITTDIEKNLTTEEINVINSSDYQTAFDNTMNLIMQNEGAISFSGDDIGTKIMSLFSDVIQNATDSNADIQYIINSYIDIIDKSDEMALQDKELIYAGLSVAASSCEFWDEMGIK